MRPPKVPTLFRQDPLWYKDAVLYEVHVRAFADSNGDGIGDFRGLTEKLDYLEDLGVTALWLLPFYPSPLKDDGYDIADYRHIHPDYGNLADFKRFLAGAHRRGIRVVTELVINHTSDQHPWFERARRAKPGSPERDFYVWSDSPERFAEARVIFQDFEASNWSWDPVAEAYYWHRFYHHQPDLNFHSPDVQRELFKVLDFWLALGVDGLRLDAVPYLFEREGTNCENLPETHELLRSLRAHVDRKFDNRMLLAEANQWPEDSAAYFGDGDECHMAFHFPVMPRLFMALRMEDRFPVIDILEQTPEIPESAQWAVFLRNHDELTLEMVTDEDRDYMYRVYASDPKARVNLGIRRRLAPLLGNDRRRIELMNALLFSLPGTPVLYYGDEIGMGDNFYLGDRNGVRTPMQWSPDRNAGFSRANPQQLYLPVVIDPEYHFEAINVEAQQANPHSLLSWTKRLIALRRRYRAFGRGKIEFLKPANPKVAAFVRSFENETILVVANLSRFAQHVELDLSRWSGVAPVELFGQSRFPPVGELPYLLTLGGHGFYWFSLSEEDLEGTYLPAERVAGGEAGTLPLLSVRGNWQRVLTNAELDALELALARWLPQRRWFAGKAKRLRELSISDVVPIAAGRRIAALLVLTADYGEGEPETYALFLGFATGGERHRLEHDQPGSIIARLDVAGRKANTEHGVLFDAVYQERFCHLLLESIAGGKSFRLAEGARSGMELNAEATPAFKRLGGLSEPRGARLMGAEQSNTSIVYGDRLVLKLFRRFEAGENPDLEIGRYLTETARFAHVPAAAGNLDFVGERGHHHTLGILQAYVENQGDAWQVALDAAGRFFERVAHRRPRDPHSSSARYLLAASRRPIPSSAREVIGLFTGSAELLGQRTAELHQALAAGGDEAFRPQPFTLLFQRSLYQSFRTTALRTLDRLAAGRPALGGEEQKSVVELLALRERLIERSLTLLDHKIEAQRIRCHGDYHLGQVLATGRDFVIIDFEGEPARPLGERRIKRSPLTDVAGMLRSFHYAAHTALEEAIDSGVLSPAQRSSGECWADYWSHWNGTVFLASYLKILGRAPLLPTNDDDLVNLLDLFLLDKALYELRYELDHRPTWLRVPLASFARLLPSA